MVWTLRVESPQYVASFCVCASLMTNANTIRHNDWVGFASLHISTVRCRIMCAVLVRMRAVCNEPSRYAISHSQFWCSSEHRVVSPIWLIRYADSLTDASGADSSNADGGLWRRLLAGGLVPLTVSMKHGNQRDVVWRRRRLNASYTWCTQTLCIRMLRAFGHTVVRVHECEWEWI